jgi:Phage tail lysozyme
MTAHVTAPMLAAFDHFLSVGFTKNGAAAAVGNFCQESGELLIAAMFRPHPDYSGGVPEALKSGGIAEWLGDRKTACIAFTARAEQRLGVAKGSLLNDLGTQCDFVVYELQTNPRYATLHQQLTTGTRGIANLSANFMMVYEVPALATANLDNRIAHAEAVVARAAEIKAAHGSQPASPAPLPQAPPPALPVQTVPAGRAPVSASAAGRRAAVLDNIGAMRDALLAERAAIDAEIAILDTTAANFGKLDAIPAPPALQKPEAAGSAVPLTQRKQTVFGTNWMTTIGGIGAILTAAGAGFHALSTGDMASAYGSISGIVAGIGLLMAKDHNVTGGTVSNVTGAVGLPVSLVDKEKHR